MSGNSSGDGGRITTMSSLEAALPSYNEKFLKQMRELGHSRDRVAAEIRRESDRKRDLEEALRNLRSELDEVDRSLKAKNDIKTELEKTIEEGEKDFRRILESTEALVGVLQRDSEKIQSAIVQEESSCSSSSSSSSLNARKSKPSSSKNSYSSGSQRNLMSPQASSHHQSSTSFMMRNSNHDLMR